MANLGYVQVTRRCNQACRFCSNPENLNNLTFEEGVGRTRSLVKAGYDGVIFTGGEPTLSDDLPRFLEHCRDNGIPCRIITNGQRCADGEYVRRLKDAGLTHVHLSVYSVKPEVQAALSRNEGSLANALKALDHFQQTGGISVDINTAINRYNADHLSENVRSLVKRFPFLRHFVWNNLDPNMNRAAENPDTIPKLRDFEVELKKAVSLLEVTGRTYRVERVPLCYMDGFEHASTETRKIVKGEERTVFFLDQKGAVRQRNFAYSKAECCRACRLDPICAGLYAMDSYYSSEELYPVMIDCERIRNRILHEDGERPVRQDG